jgi:DNA-binding beta-propeller fold protein YncE
VRARLRAVALWVVATAVGAGCNDPATARYPEGRPRQSQSLQLDARAQVLAVVNPDADSISIIDPKARVLLREIQLAARPTATGGRYEPSLGPRGVDLSPDGKLAYVACQWSGQLLTVDVDSGELKQAVPIGAEPVSVLVHPSGAAVYVASYQSSEVTRLPLVAGLPDATQAVRQRTTARPWGLALDGDGGQLYVTRFLLAPGLDILDAATLQVRSTAALADVAPRGNRLLAHGVPRGVYAAVVRPGPTPEVWLPHLLLATDVAQPDLDFESTVFPAVSVRASDGAPLSVLSIDSRLPGLDGAFADVVSGPRAVAFTPDGGLALVLDAASEDVLVVDAQQRVELDLLRPLPGHLPEGIVLSPDGLTAFIDERASGDVAVLSIAADWQTRQSGRVRLDGAPIPRLATADPMPAELRLGQRLFYSANSAEFPITKNFWMACSSCHLEGRSDAVTWLFAAGPRDTPSNAGGTQGTGFLLRTAARSAVNQYDETIRVEQGGALDLTRASDKKLLDSLMAYVDGAIPLPRSPELDLVTHAPSAAAERGRPIFSRLGCAQCHDGPRLTDSGRGNPALDLSGKTGPVLLHDVGTCVASPFADRPSLAYDGSARAACAFDTPSLLGLHDSAPYLHDGRAATIGEAVDYFVNFLKVPPPTAAERDDLIAYLRSL